MAKIDNSSVHGKGNNIIISAHIGLISSYIPGQGKDL